MAAFCPAPDPDLGLVRGMLGSVDCNVQALAQAGYGALSRPGSPMEAALVILLTLYIAVMGLRLMLGLGSLRVGEWTLAALKIGAILALATQWPTYQHLVFGVLVNGPEQLGTSILKGLDPAAGSFAADPLLGLQAAYDELQQSAQYYSQHASPQTSPLQGGMGFSAMGLTLSAMLLLLNTLGALLVAKIVLALLLALGPVFIAMMLFDSTRGLFEGWLRAAAGFALVPLVSILGLVVQLTILEPQILQLADMRGQSQVNPGLVNGIVLLCLIFTLVTAALMIAIAVIALGFRLPSPGRSASATDRREPARSASAPAEPVPLAGQPERAARIALAAAALDRRDERTALGEEPARSRFAMAVAGGAATYAETVSGRGLALGQRRTAQPRRAASNQRRDT
jgi:type IV secretion system protein VirB6